MKAFVIGLVVIIAVAVIGGGVYFYTQNYSFGGAALTEASPTPAPTPTPEIVEESEEDPDAVEITVEGKEFEFLPDEITIPAGQKVRVVFSNIGQSRHDWVIEDTEIRTKLIEGGTTDSVEFTFDEPGEYVYFCSVPGHREAGMEGVLVVE